MTDRFETFVLTINRIYRCIQRIKDREMEALGLKGSHVMCLFQLRQHPEGLTAAELAERRLEELGLVELPEEGGKRRYRAKLRLTEAGRAAAERMTGKIRQAVQRGGRGLTDGQREDFYRALGVIARNLEQICSTEEPI